MPLTVYDLLLRKGSGVHTIDPERSLADVVKRLVEHNIGSLVVCSAHGGTGDPPCVGIITERDILRACANQDPQWSERRVYEAMTADLVVGHPSDTVESVMARMTERRIRHLPIVDKGELAGMISIGDVVKAQLNQAALENELLKSYIHTTA
jgi:CBS domain-containing protein